MARSKRIPASLTLTPSDEINAMVIKPSRHRPAVGDIFVLNMLGSRWIAGRVVSTTAGFGSEFPLLYFYKAEFADPEAFATPIKPDLLIAPVVTNYLAWRQGYYLHLRNEPLRADELLSRHVFESSLFPLDDSRRYEDEHGKPTNPPPHGPPTGFDGKLKSWFRPWQPASSPAIPVGWTGIWNYAAIDVWLSWTLGIAEKPVPSGLTFASTDLCIDNIERKGPKIALVLLMPPVASKEFDVSELEEELTEAIERSKVGRWEGHGTDLRTGMHDIRFAGNNLEQMVDAMAPILRRVVAQLPRGWSLVAQIDGTQRLVDLP
jgi:hypothetical protein